MGGVGALNEFDIVAASEWDAQDGDVIGTGAFRFVTWAPGQVARIERHDDYFVPSYQATLDAGLRVPALDAIVYRLFRNVQAGVFQDGVAQEFQPFVGLGLIQAVLVAVGKVHQGLA